MRAGSFFRRHVALPGDHGTWALLLGPLLIGLFAGGRWHTTSAYLVVASLCALLIRQPVTLVVKAYCGRRPREILPAAWLWVGIYGTVGLLHVAGLVIRGFGYLLYLAAAAMPVFAWYLVLIGRRAERRRPGVEILAAGAFALAAPAGLWVGLGHPAPVGWLLWLLVWAQSAASVVHAHMRLEQRSPGERSGPALWLPYDRAAFLLTSGNLAAAAVLGFAGAAPRWLFVPFAVQWLETLGGILRPARGHKPRTIGFRLAAVSALITLLFIITWRIG